MTELEKQLAEALESLLRRDEGNTCQHEETYRGGVLWEICRGCGAKWAYDEGGKPEWADPPEWAAAREALAAFAAQQPAPSEQPAEVPVGEREALLHNPYTPRKEDFDALYLSLCDRPISIREIARRCWKAGASIAQQPATTPATVVDLPEPDEASDFSPSAKVYAASFVRQLHALAQQPAALVGLIDEQIKAARAEGRGEALALILQLDAEEGLDDFTVNHPIGCTGDYGCAWNEEKLREWLSADDKAWSLICNFEGAYWERVGLRDEARGLVKRLREKLSAQAHGIAQPEGNQP